MKRLLFFISICIIGLNVSCSSDDKDDPENPSNVTNTIVLNGITYKLTPVPAAEWINNEDPRQKIYNTYTVDYGVSSGDYCGAYYIIFTTENGYEIEWWFNSTKDPFNTTYVYATECGQEQGENYDAWFLLEGENENERRVFSADDKGNSITTSVKDNTFTIKGTFIDKVSGHTGTINVSISNFVIK